MVAVSKVADLSIAAAPEEEGACAARRTPMGHPATTGNEFKRVMEGGAKQP
jgi:hypothetical protein